MNPGDIDRLATDAAFTPGRKYVQLAEDHVPFDELTGYANYETKVVRALEADADVGIFGPRGGGKSSLIAYVSEHLSAEFSVLRIPITIEDPTKISNIAAVALSEALRTLELSKDQRSDLQAARADSVTHGRAAASKGWRFGGGSIPAELHGELGTLRQQLANNQLATDRLAGLDRLINILVARHLRPVFVLEDTEAAIGTADQPELTAGFLGGPVRVLTQELEAPCVIAIQDAFRATPGFANLTANLQRIDIPMLDRGALEKIIERRLRGQGLHTTASDFISPTALAMLITFYDEMQNNLRFTLSALQSALGHAASLGADRVDDGPMRAAVNEWRQRMTT